MNRLSWCNQCFSLKSRPALAALRQPFGTVKMQTPQRPSGLPQI